MNGLPKSAKKTSQKSTLKFPHARPLRCGLSQRLHGLALTNRLPRRLWAAKGISRADKPYERFLPRGAAFLQRRPRAGRVMAN
jgi:hypothetical protein